MGLCSGNAGPVFNAGQKNLDLGARLLALFHLESEAVILYSGNVSPFSIRGTGKKKSINAYAYKNIYI